MSINGHAINGAPINGAAAAGADPGPAGTSVAPVDTDPIWLLVLDIGGRVERFATRPCEVPNWAGETWYHRGGLANLTRGIGRGSDVQGFEVDDGETEWATIEHLGERLYWAKADLYWWRPGEVLEEALHVLSGVVTDYEFGDPAELSRLSITVDARASWRATLYPGPQAVFDGTTWTDDRAGGTEVIDAQIIGSPYPIVFGYPGAGDDEASAPIGSPGYAVAVDGTTDSKIVICIGEVDAAQVEVHNMKQAASGVAVHETWSVATTTDLLGQTVSYAVVPIGTALDLDEGQEWFVGWNKGTGDGGGVIRADSTLIRGLGDVLVWALERAGIPTDVQRQRGETTALNRFKIDTFLSGTRTDMEKWIESRLVPLFPIRRMSSGKGLWYRFVNYDARITDAVRWFDVDEGQLELTSGKRLVRGPLFNTFTLEYGRNPVNGRYTARRVLAAEHEAYVPGLGVDERVVGSPVCRASIARFGVLEAPPIQTDVTWSDSTAVLALQHWAARDSMPLYTISGQGFRLDEEGLLPGDVVVLDCDRLGMSEQLALVDEMVIGGPTVRLDFVLLPQIGRRTT